MYRRNIRKFLENALGFMPVVLIRGARKTGKKTLVQSLTEKNFSYLSFNHLPTLKLAKEDPIGFISRLKTPIILDEIQRVPELFLSLKSAVDQNRVPGQYILTGSADPLLLPKLGDSLAGRMRLLTLWPLSQGEILGRQETFLETVFAGTLPATGTKTPCSKTHILECVLKGGFPTSLAHASEEERGLWFQDYVTLVLQKDILELAHIENITHMPHLLGLAAARMGGLLNTDEFSRASKLSSTTLRRYLGLLQTLFMLVLLPAWHNHLGKKLVKSPKLYLCDTALALNMLGVERKKLEEDPYLLGSLVENFVVMEILKQISWSRKNIRVYHYRDYHHMEVDIVLESPSGEVVAIEVKSGETIGKEDFKGLKAFQEVAGEKFVQGILLYAGDTHLPYGEKLTASPLSSLWN